MCYSISYIIQYIIYNILSCYDILDIIFYIIYINNEYISIYFIKYMIYNITITIIYIIYY